MFEELFLNNALAEFLSTKFFGNGLSQYGRAFVAFVIVLLLIKIFKSFLLIRLEELTKKTKTEIDDLLVKVVEEFGWTFYVVVAALVSIRFIDYSENVGKAVAYVTIIVFTYYGIKGIHHLIGFTAEHLAKKRGDGDSSVIMFMGGILKIVLWVIAVLLILQNLGYNVTSLAAGLGIGGIAVALGVQAILGDLLASLSIYLDKPFKIGDFIVIDDIMGTVSKIGIKTTRITSLWGDEVVMSNTDLTSSRVHNYKRMQKRRVHFNLSIRYETPAKKIRKIPGLIEQVFKKIPLAEFDRAHLKEFAESGLKYEIAYYVDTSDYNKYMDIRQEANIRIMETLEKEKIGFAYPTRTILMKKK